MPSLNERTLVSQDHRVKIDAKPFVKWVGGKRQLLPELLPLLLKADASAVYHEPFVGGGAVYFALRGLGRAVVSRLADVNQELVNAYVAIKDFPNDVIGRLREHARNNSEEYFYLTRKARPTLPSEAAARLIYLNKTCFNGLYRVNSSGGFNAPWGKYANPTICDESNIRAVSAALVGAAIAAMPFLTVLEYARTGDLVYFDPPYVPVSTTSHFTEYTVGGFGFKDQCELASAFRELDKKGVGVALSNSDVPEVRQLYHGFRSVEVSARRNINTRGDRRGPVAELIVCNF